MKLLFRWAAFLFCAVLVVQPAVSQQSAGAECTDPTASLLWTVEGKNSTVHLFGSIHLGEAGFYPLHPTIESTYNKADHVVFEVDPTSMADSSLLGQIQAKGMLRPDEQLSDYLSPTVIEDLKMALQDMGLPAANFMRFRPWMLTMVLTQLQMASLGYVPQYGVEYYLLGKKPAGADVLELESINSQLAFLQQLDGEAHLAYTLLNLDTGTEQMHRLAEAWRCADKPTLEELLIGEFETESLPGVDLEALKKALLDDRNIAMAEHIEEFLESGSGEYFVIVGAAHYVGEESIIQQLREKNHTVTPVKL